MNEKSTPKQLVYRFPAEWEKHEATWLSWPHNVETWSGDRLKKILPAYLKFIKIISEGEMVCINVNDMQTHDFLLRQLQNQQTDLQKIKIFIHPTNDSWCRDHGPAFLVNPDQEQAKIIVNWEYNAWGGKYPPFESDNQIPIKVGESLNLPVWNPGIVMEGGSVEFNGRNTLITTESCLLNPNRNPHLNKLQIEKYLVDYYGVDQIVWLHQGIEGDDTDGHVDDLTRFVNEDTIVTVYEEKKADANYNILKKNIKTLSKTRLLNGKQLNIVEVPLPNPVYSEGIRLPASYANFYICNHAIIIPFYDTHHDEQILEVLQSFFKDRKAIGIDSSEIIWGLGSFHCLSQQEPTIPAQ